MANQDGNNIVENMVNASKQAVDTMVENTKKIANGNSMVNDTVEKGSEWYKNWLDTQKNIFSKTTEKAATATETVKDNASQMTDFYQNWMNSQMAWAKNMWETSQNHMKNATSNNTAADMNPMNMWNNMTSNATNWMNNMNQGANFMNQANNFMNQAKSFNPMNMMNMDSWKSASQNWTGMFNQYYEMLNNNFSNMQKNMENGTMQDAFRNMVNVSEGFTRFAEMWTPMMKSLQDKSFNMDMYKQYMNPSMYKDMMDKYFGFLPEGSREYIKNMTDMMQNGAAQFGQNNMGNFNQMRGMMGNMMPNSSDIFSNMLNGYNSMYSNLNNAMAPVMKMMTPNQHTKSMAEWNDITNRMMVYSIKNAEMQYHIYTQGTKAMDKIAESLMSKMQNGEETPNMLAMYQEWLNISDKTFVELFESDEYSQMMAEVSAMQMKLRKDVEGQMEKMMSGLPIATRSEMDEMYKTIYDLKKQVRQLEKMLEIGGEETPATEAPAAAPTVASDFTAKRGKK